MMLQMLKKQKYHIYYVVCHQLVAHLIKPSPNYRLTLKEKRASNHIFFC